MKVFWKYILLFAFALMTHSALAQSSPTHHSRSTNLYLMGGYQYLSQPTGPYNVATIHAEVFYSNISGGTRVGLSYGQDYLSFSLAGALMFPTVLLATDLDDIEEPFVKAVLFFTAVSAWQFRIPLTNHTELNFGWDALKVTKLKNYSDTYYVTGSLNVGLTRFLNDSFFICGYYEYNHTHNTGIRLLNWVSNTMYMGTLINNSQPDILTGHSFGARIGWML